MNQKSFIYPGSIHEIESILINIRCSNIFLVSGNQSFEKSGAKDKISSLLKDYKVTEFKGFSVNPKLKEARKGYKLFKKSNSDLILAVGGGSIIDMSKIIKYLYLSENNFKQSSSIPIIAAPTTAGTGSEATHFAVVYINDVKESYTHEFLLPNYAIVDSNLLQGQSKYQIAVSGLDAFAQGVESYWNINSTEESMKYAKMAIKLVWNNLENTINGNQTAKINLSEGAYLAGKAINITKTTAPHALSYGFTSLFGLPHGHAVALFLPFFFYHHLNLSQENCNDPRGADFVKTQIQNIRVILNLNSDDIEFQILSFIRKCGLEINFQKLNISSDQFNEGLKLINQDRLQNNPGQVNDAILRTIFEFNKSI